MKQIVNSKSIPMLVLLSSLLAALLRLWTRGTGPNADGLFASKPLVWAMLWLLTAAVAFAVWYAVRGLKNPGTYRDNYPQSIPMGLCAVPAAFICLISSAIQLRDSVAYALPETTIVDTVTGLMGLVAGLCLLLSAAHRCMGRKPFFLINGLICLYLAVRLFNCCRLWSNEPQVGLVVFPFLASMSLMLAAYYRVRFDVDLGKRNWGAFWCLISVYLCVVAMLSFDQPLFYGLCALWQLSNLCSLRPIKRRVREEEPEQPEELA